MISCHFAYSLVIQFKLPIPSSLYPGLKRIQLLISSWDGAMVKVPKSGWYKPAIDATNGVLSGSNVGLEYLLGSIKYSIYARRFSILLFNTDSSGVSSAWK